MTDLEMITLCAAAVGLQHVDGRYYPANCDSKYFKDGYAVEYNPFKDDAQAMELVKKFTLHSVYRKVHDDWVVWTSDYSGTSKNLNRAIVECVANLKRRQT